MMKFVLHLLVLSHSYSIPSLKRVCIYLIEQGWLSKENVVDVLQLARNCDAPRLSLICVRMVVKDFKTISSTEGWKVMKQVNPALEQELLESVVEADSVSWFLFPFSKMLPYLCMVCGAWGDTSLFCKNKTFYIFNKVVLFYLIECLCKRKVISTLLVHFLKFGILGSTCLCQRKEERLKKKEERKVYSQLYEAMEALLHICRDGCRTIGPRDKVFRGNQAACDFPACKGLETLVRHFSSCKTRVPGGCAHCKRMWQLLELHSRICDEPDSCKVPLCR